MDQEAVAVGHDVQVVDPDVRGYVYSLVTALGGFNGEDADRYMLGDDALACLRDIKRWLKLYDEKNNRMDVARCLGEANLVNGDLLPILSVWWTNGQKSKHMTRIALTCLELLVPLTWPVEFHSQMTVNHHRHTPYIQQVQVQYKRNVLKYGGANLLRAIIRIALPSMAISRSERESRDEGILKLMLYFLRNIVIITTNARLAAEGEEEETSRSATINAFQDQDAFALILTMCSNVGDDFNLQDVVLLEILFHLVKGISVDKLFMNDTQKKIKQSDELAAILRKEELIKREYAKNAPTRHGRFGTMIWVKRNDGAKVSTVSGQDVLRDDQTTFQKMDQSKKWNKPRPRRRKDDVPQNNDFNMPIHLSSSATKNLRTFVEEFLDSGFNPLFTHVRKAIEREAERIMDINVRQFFYTVGWFLEAERTRRARKMSQDAEKGKSAKDVEPDSYGLVAGVLNQETFISLNRAMQSSMDNKEWDDLTAQMRCFTQILLTVQDMALSPIEEDQEIAENIQNRIFYEETTHDRVLSIIRGYKDQGFGYLDAATELAHVFLRMLERYSKENADLQIRAKRKARRKKKTDHPEAQNGEDNDEEQNSEEEDLVDATQVTKERAFDFKRFASKFCNQSCVDTFVTFTSYYKELNSEQLKRAHRYFYRIAFKQEMTVLLFRLDIINLFHRMVKGPGPIDNSKPIFKEWEELVRQIIRRLVKRLDQRPALITELLFSKMNSTVFYLEYGHERQTISTNKKRPAMELQIISSHADTPETKTGIVVGALVLDGQADLVKWVVDVLNTAASEREDWETQDEARRAESPEAASVPHPIIPVKPRDEACQKALFLNGKLRLLMSVAGFERLGMEDVEGASWIVPSAMSSTELREIVSNINKAIMNPIPEGSHEDPRDMLQRRDAGSARQSAVNEMLNVDFGSDSEGEDLPDGPLFPPNPRAKSNALDELKKKRKKKRKDDDGAEKEPLDDETLEARRQARLSNTLARQAKIKSDLFIHASDEETDEEADREFFRLEEERRKEQAENVKKALLTGNFEQALPKSKGKKPSVRKRKSDTTAKEPKRRRRGTGSGDSGEGSDDGYDDDVLMADANELSTGSLQEISTSHGAQDEDTPLTSAEDEMDFDDDIVFSRDRQSKAAARAPAADSDDEDAPIAPTSRRMRGGFVIESDSE
ncbi:Topoisomerase 1-associated factor 1 [Penicillium macrosclerotiorum]|uniref:Topoisomerase 1-associated factor 1 n=1 Tax=Penicillium macrosclerotiorum TaxID=303699 RepID=UPI002546D61F|nr:Topoisomerase 1-associated factor 1 [Penicillium macrosclerotiorum]KAJ5683138.1 Topoisomerase 1-associated factor 1 [Penicillium macrosclerotiorum]